MKHYINTLLIALSVFLMLACKKKDEEKDTKSPSIQVVSPKSIDSYNVGEKIDYEVTLTDNSGLSRCEIAISENKAWAAKSSDLSGTKQTVSGSFNIPAGVKGGKYKFVVSCTDNSNNESIDSVEFSIIGATKEVVYEELDIAIANPERGFYTYEKIGTDNTNEITADKVKNFRQSNVTLVFITHLLKDFTDKPISDAFLNRIINNMKALREGGGKAVMRFCYTDNQDHLPHDAPWEITQNHIAQLKPVFQEYADVIAVLEAGFIGTWGEWYYTSHYNFQPEQTHEAYQPRRKVLDALLDAMPKERMISVRYPAAKLFSFNIAYTDSITDADAYNGSPLSRVSAHNDCFLADSDDRGTFSGNRNYRKYWQNESKYLVMGGETCGKSSYSECENALNDMGKYHWSYLNEDYHPAVLGLWQTAGCMDEIKRRLGYRFVLSWGSFDTWGEPGNPYKIQLKIENKGWAAPYNPRNVEIIFVSAQNAAEKYKIKLKNDPRHWFSGDEVTVNTEFLLPKNMPKGIYHIYMNLPDPKPTLANKWEYSIQLANVGVWDQTTGYNKLYTITVKDGTPKTTNIKETLVKF